MLFILGKDNLKLAESEVMALSRKKSLRDGHILIADAEDTIAERLAYTSSVYKYLFSARKRSIKRAIKNFDWNKHIKKDFWVAFVHSPSVKEAEYADLIWDYVKKPKANRHSRNKITFIFTKNNVHCGILIKEIDKKPLMQRRPHLKPEHSPTSLSPKLARAMINLTGIRKGTVIDPFCGVGGILVEAGLMGFSTEGYELDKKTYFKCRHNMEYYGIKLNIRMKDALTIKKPMKYVVTDMPYGRNSMVSKDRDELYQSFMELLSEKLDGKAVVMFPNNSNYRKMIRKAGLKIEKEFSQYVHGSLTRKITIISNPGIKIMK